MKTTCPYCNNDLYITLKNLDEERIRISMVYEGISLSAKMLSNWLMGVNNFFQACTEWKLSTATPA